MSNIIDQPFISKTDTPAWKSVFSKREYEYLTHIVNGLIQFGEMDEIGIQYGEKEGVRVFHIFEPFIALNYLGFMSPSVVSISFNQFGEIGYLTGNDNGISIFSKDVTLESTHRFPKNSMLEIDFWHFVDAIGNFNEDNYS